MILGCQCDRSAWPYPSSERPPIAVVPKRLTVTYLPSFHPSIFFIFPVQTYAMASELESISSFLIPFTFAAFNAVTDSFARLEN
jgi:hypothetical protein